MSHDLAKAWETITSWFEKHAPGAFVPRPPASLAQIDAAETAIGYPLPDDYKASLLVHDGIELNDELEWFYASWLAPIDDCLEAWRGQREMDEDDADLEATDDPRVRNVLGHARRFPVLGTAYWDYDVVYLDLLPGPEGTSGQLIAMSECDFTLVAGSFGAFLERLAELCADDDLEVFRDEMMRVVTKGERRAVGDAFSNAPPGV